MTFRLCLVTEIRIVRQIKNKIDSEGNELNQCIKIQQFFNFVSHSLLSVYSFVCLNLSRAHILKQSFYTPHLVPLRFSD